METLEETTLQYVQEQEILNIMRFLSTNGFSHIKLDILEAIADLIYKSKNGCILSMGKEYERLAPKGISSESIRMKLAYYINDNTDQIRASILKKYDYDIGCYFGVKNFISQITIVYTLFARK